MNAPFEQTFEQRIKILNMARRCGLSSMYDASRDSYSGWVEKVLAFAEQLEKDKHEQTV